jgi:hypothetical protein
MRFMMMVKIPATLTADEYMPDVEIVEAMTRYNQELVDAGAMLAGDGLQHERFRVGSAGVIDGPYSEAKEMVGGYWIIDVRSRDEAIEWARRAPMADGHAIDLRQVAELDDYPADVAEAAQLSQVPPEQTSARR